MGGYGSGGGPARYRTVEGCHALDVRRLHRDGCLRPGSVVFSSWLNRRTGENDASISVCVQQDQVVLSYRHRRPGKVWQDIEEPVELTWTRCSYGSRTPPQNVIRQCCGAQNTMC
jgi:hypothetical protein